MKLLQNRTILALALTVLAVVFPCAAWYLVGSREAGHQVADLTRNASQTAHDTAVRLAQQLSQRLGVLLEAEARRPYYHYQQYFHDPQGAAEGSAVVPSPLSSGPSDPLVKTYFQVDGASGRVTLPTAQAELSQYEQLQARRSKADEQLYLKRQLERGIASILTTVRGESLPAKKFQARTSAQQAYGQRVDVLDESAWLQNCAASELYKDLKNASNAQNDAVQFQAVKGPPEDGTVQIYVGPMKWRTIYVADTPSLIALREVTTPQGAVLQGFLLSASGLADFFRTVGLPAKLQPGPAIGELDAPINITDEPWRVVVNPTVTLAEVARQAADLRHSFLAIFGGGVAVAVMAALGVVWIVWQTERLARQRSQFAASAAHELRTPLAGLRLYSDMLAEGLGDAAKAQTYAQRVADEAERLGRVVANVLGFTRLERGTLNVQSATGNLADVVRESVTRQQPALEAAGARLEVALDEQLPTVKFDRDAMAQIVQNLLDNAEKHTRHASNRTIQVTLTLAPANNAVELTIADHGPGVPAEVRRHLFEAFARGNENDAPAGLGLGLVLVKALAEAQGATVTYNGNNGGGAKFVVRFEV